MTREVAPASDTPTIADTWLNGLSTTVSSWKNRTVAAIKKTAVYDFCDQNCRTFKSNHPVIYAIALTALTILTVIFTFNWAVSALNRTVFAIVPVLTIVPYIEMLFLMAKKVFQAWQVCQKASA